MQKHIEKEKANTSKPTEVIILNYFNMFCTAKEPEIKGVVKEDEKPKKDA